jgi:hypothetical protein
VTLPQYSALDHWYGSRANRQLSALSTRIDDVSGKGRHGSRIGTLISVVGGWFNLGEQAGGGNNGIQPPTIDLSGGGSYSWCARVRRSTSSNWGDHYHVVQGATSTGGAGNQITFWNLDHPGQVFATVHNNFGTGSDWTRFVGGLWIGSPSAWSVDAAHTMVCTYNASSTTMRVYIDGVLIWIQTGCAANTGAAVLAWFVWDGGGGQSWGHESDNVLYWPGVVLTDGSAANGDTATGEVAQALAYLDIDVSSVSPADGATGVGTTDSLTITCDRAPTIGAGNLTIKRTADDSTFQTIDITDGSKVSVSGSVITITHDAFAGGVGYYVLLDVGAIAGIGAITSTTAWNFTTASGGTTLALTGASVTNTLAAGTAAPSSEVPLTAASITSTLAAGTQSPTLTLPLSGSAAAASLASGDMAPGVGPILSSATLAVAQAAGDMAMGERTVALSTATDDVAPVAGTVAPDTSKAITGEAIGVTIADGSVAPGLAPALSGAALDIAAEAGTVSPTLTIGLLGAAADIALTAGTISYAADGNITLSLSGLALDVVLSAGTAGVAHSQAISGAEAGGAVSSGSLTPGTSSALSVATVGLGLATSDLTTARSVAASGTALSLAATAGSMTRSLTIGLSGAAATLALAAGTLTYAQDSNVTVALSGAALSLALTAGTVVPSATKALGGVGAAVAQSAGLASPGLSVGVSGADGAVAVADGSLTPSHSRVLSSAVLSLLASSGNVLPSGGTPVEAIARLLGTFSVHKPGVVASWAKTRPNVTATFEDD